MKARYSSTSTPSGVTLPRRPPRAVPSTKSAAPPTKRFRKQTAKLSAFLVTDLFHGPDRVKTVSYTHLSMQRNITQFGTVPCSLIKVRMAEIF